MGLRHQTGVIRDASTRPARNSERQETSMGPTQGLEGAPKDLDAPSSTPRISVIIPSYNAAPFLREALTSVLNQVPRPHEVLVQDGGSTDGTLEVLHSVSDDVAWVSSPDHGQADALNKALARATGDVILWLNADDVLLPGAIAAALAAFASDPRLAFAYGDFDIIDSAGSLVRRYQSALYSWERVYARGCYIFSGSVFIRRVSLTNIGGYDAELRACMDFDLLLRLNTVGRSTHLRRTIAQLRMHSGNKSSSIMPVFLGEGFRVRLRFARRSPRLLLIALRAAALSAVMLASTRLRLSPWWPRHGRGKSL
jgi:glycosyltransferase involved in cell wall biosynthesis